MKKKKLVIITGITGAIGSALLAEYATQKDTVIYGISRKAKFMLDFCLKGFKLPPATLICSIGQLNYKNIKWFLRTIDFKEFSSVTYIHGLGHYPFEVAEDGKVLVSNDKDNDGVDDLCMELTFETFTLFPTYIRSVCPKGFPVTAVLFGGIADIHRLQILKSWCTVMNKTKAWMLAYSDIAKFRLFNISSVICTHEIIERPFVFTDTNADHRYWLKPYELAKKVIQHLRKDSKEKEFIEHDIFHPMPNFPSDYYTDAVFTPGKVKELYGK